MNIELYSRKYKIEFDQDTWVHLEVYSDDYCELHLWRVDGKTYKSRPYRSGDEVDKSGRIVRGMLEEEEFIELRRVGPEDREYFVTDTFWETVNK